MIAQHTSLLSVISPSGTKLSGDYDVSAKPNPGALDALAVDVDPEAPAAPHSIISKSRPREPKPFPYNYLSYSVRRTMPSIQLPSRCHRTRPRQECVSGRPLRASHARVPPRIRLRSFAQMPRSHWIPTPHEPRRSHLNNGPKTAPQIIGHPLKRGA